MNMTIRRKLFLAFGLVLVLAIGQSFFVLQSLSENNRSSITEIRNALRTADRATETQALFEITAVDVKQVLSRAELISSVDAQARFDENYTDFFNYLQLLKSASMAGDEVQAIENKAEEWKSAVQLYLSGTQVTNLPSDQKLQEYEQSLLIMLDALSGKTVSAAAKVDKAANAKLVSTRNTSIILIVIISIVSLGISFVISRNLGGSIVKLSDAMGKIADGELETEIPAMKRDDEVGQMAKTLGSFLENERNRQNLIEQQKQAEDEQRKRAEEELVIKEQQRVQREEEKQIAQMKSEEQREVLVKSMAADFKGMISEIVDSVSNQATMLRQHAGTVSSSAEKTNTETQSAQTASTKLSSYISEMANATSEVNQSVNGVRRQVTKSTDIARTAVSGSEDAAARMEALSNAGAKVNEVVGLISDIASQTNLLALNATIEAARAGEAGKGFAVVATEVKNLAEQTARATGEIDGYIGEMVGATHDAEQAIDTVSGIISEMNDITLTVSHSIDDQEKAIDLITNNTRSATAVTGEVSETISMVRENAEEGIGASNNVLEAANTLSSTADQLNAKSVQFLENLVRKGT
jgi:methyl-accepting chemotaxis protein